MALKNSIPTEGEQIKIRRPSNSHYASQIRRTLDSGETLATNEPTTQRKKAFVFLDDLELSYDLSEAAEKQRMTTYTYWSIESSMDTFWPDIDLIIMSAALWQKLQEPLFAKLKEKFMRNHIFVLNNRDTKSISNDKPSEIVETSHIHYIDFDSKNYSALFTEIFSELSEN